MHASGPCRSTKLIKTLTNEQSSHYKHTHQTACVPARVHYRTIKNQETNSPKTSPIQGQWCLMPQTPNSAPHIHVINDVIPLANTPNAPTHSVDVTGCAP
jgi:hypothetical protein